MTDSANFPSNPALQGQEVGFVIDSSSQIPPELARTFDVQVVPITLTIDHKSYREGIDLDADDFYNLVGDQLPEITTSQPSPGDFVAVFDALAGRGVAQILCVTVDASHSGTFNSARIAAQLFGETSPIPVRLVDSRTISFGTAACLWEAATALLAGATLEAAAQQAEHLAPAITSTFVLTTLDQVRRMGRVDFDEIQGDSAGEGTAVYLTRDGAFDTVGQAATLTGLCTLMADQVPTDIPIRIGVSLADPATLPYTEALEAILQARPNVLQVLRYRVGPSIAAHTGIGTAGLFFWPA